jgi:hypothetical protein
MVMKPAASCSSCKSPAMCAACGCLSAHMDKYHSANTKTKTIKVKSAAHRPTRSKPKP